MPSIEDIVRRMRESPQDVRFADLCAVCDNYFGRPRQRGGSHRIFKTPWAGDPRVNIQGEGGKAKACQVRQVLKALEKIEDEAGEDA